MFMWLDVRLFDSPLLSAHVKLIKRLTMWRFTFSFSLSIFRTPSCVRNVLKRNRTTIQSFCKHKMNWSQFCSPKPNIVRMQLNLHTDNLSKQSTWNRNRTTVRFWNVVNLHLYIIMCHDGIAYCLGIAMVWNCMAWHGMAY